MFQHAVYITSGQGNQGQTKSITDDPTPAAPATPAAQESANSALLLLSSSCTSKYQLMQ